MPSFTGGTLDESVQVVYSSSGERAKKLIIWSQEEQNFQLSSDSKQGGIIGLSTESDATLDAETSNRSESKQIAGKSPFLYAKDDTWIWDYEEAPASVPPGASEVQLGSVPDTDTTPPTAPVTKPPVGGSGATDGSGGGDATDDNKVTMLSSPTFSLPSGNYPLASFDLSVLLQNPNPAGSSDIYYSVNYGNWALYSSGIKVSPGAVVSAQAVATSSLYSNSSRVENKYEAEPAVLLAPLIRTDLSEFGIFVGHDVTVTLVDENPTGTSKLEYRVGGGGWKSYTDPFVLCRNDYPKGAVIEARAVPVVQFYTTSPPTLRSLGLELPIISGDASGAFSNPMGEKGMITNLDQGKSSNLFSWGRDYFLKTEKAPENAPNLSQSSMSFYGSGFKNVKSGDPFLLGALQYYNGTIVDGSKADSVVFTVRLNVRLSGVVKSAQFDFKFDIFDIVNSYEDEWEDADYVRLASTTSAQVLDFNGIFYRLELEFGNASKEGYTKFNEFHVLEEEKAKAELYGRLIEVGNTGYKH